MQFHFRDLALQAQQEPAIRATRIIDPVAIGDQALLVAAQIQQWIPVGAVTRQTGDIDRENDPDLVRRDLADQLLEPFPVLCGGGRQAQIGVNDLNVVLVPPQLQRPCLQCVLQAQALLIGQYLMGAGLANVDDRPVRQMAGGDELVVHAKSPEQR